MHDTHAEALHLDKPQLDDAMTAFRAAFGTRTYTIGTLAELFGVSRRTLRFYEERELLRPLRDGTQRVYSEEDRMRLDIIVRAKRLGFSLAAIWDLIERRALCRGSQAAPGGSEAAPGVCEGLALSRDEISAQIERLTNERQRVHRAIEELREAATRYSHPGDERPAPKTGT